MENIYAEIDSNRKSYFNFYNDYRRGGVGEGEYASKTEKIKNQEEKDAKKEDKTLLANILTELVNIQDHQSVLNKGKRSKNQRIRPQP